MISFVYLFILNRFHKISLFLEKILIIDIPHSNEHCPDDREELFQDHTSRASFGSLQF